MMKIDTLILHADLFTMKGDGVGYIEDGAVAIDRGKITAVGDSSTLSAQYDAEEVIDATDKMVLPGFVDCHMHSHLNLFRGVAQDTSFWMLKGLAPFANRSDAKGTLAAAKVNALEVIAAGTTTLCDYTDAGIVFELAEFYQRAGLRAQLTSNVREAGVSPPNATPRDLYVFEPERGRKLLETNIELVKKWHGRNDNMTTVTISPQGPDFLSIELMLECKRVATELGVKLHMHVAQGDRETIQIQGRYNKRPIAFLDELGYLDNRLICVHLTDATEDEARLAASRGCSMVVCSGSIGIIDGIVPPAAAFQEGGGIVGLGTDQASGNNCNSILNEMKLTALFNKIRYADPEKMPAGTVLRMATIDGAKAMGLDHLVGSIEEGKHADILFIDMNASSMLPIIRKPVRNQVPNLVYAARGDEIRRVMIDGKTVYKNGKYLTLDAEGLKQDFRASSEAVLALISAEDVKHTTVYQYTSEGKY